jgi:hypothetical protein
MATTLDYPFGIDDLDKVFIITDFLENTNELIEEFKPEVLKILVKKSFFTGHFRIKYNEMFDELITSLIRKQITKHFQSFSPEDILILTDTGLLKMIAGIYFDQDQYIPMERDTNEQYEN